MAHSVAKTYGFNPLQESENGSLIVAGAFAYCVRHNMTLHQLHQELADTSIIFSLSSIAIEMLATGASWDTIHPFIFGHLGEEAAFPHTVKLMEDVHALLKAQNDTTPQPETLTLDEQTQNLAKEFLKTLPTVKD